jgi:7-carboxy-7-deazaguanine synthase
MDEKTQLDILESGLQLPITEEFYTLQGEGYHTGKAAYFIRIGGCDVCCSWCDSKYSWVADLNRMVPIEEIAAKVAGFAAKAVVVTGGEPSSYNLTPLCNELKKNGILTFIETSGAYPLTGVWDWICLSPKKNRPPVESNFMLAHELKVVISSEDDFAWAEENAKMVSPDCRLYLQTEWSKFKQLTPIVVEYIKANPKWSASLQVHKFMKIP